MLTEVIDKLFLELSQVTTAKTARELVLETDNERQAKVIEAMREALGAIEWIEAQEGDRICPACHATYSRSSKRVARKHFETCRLHAALALAGGGE